MAGEPEFTEQDQRALIEHGVILTQILNEVRLKPDRSELSSTKVQDHEDRIRLLEKSISVLRAALILLGAIWPIVVGLLLKLVHF